MRLCPSSKFVIFDCWGLQWLNFFWWGGGWWFAKTLPCCVWSLKFLFHYLSSQSYLSGAKEGNEILFSWSLQLVFELGHFLIIDHLPTTLPSPSPTCAKSTDLSEVQVSGLLRAFWACLWLWACILPSVFPGISGGPSKTSLTKLYSLTKLPPWLFSS